VLLDADCSATGEAGRPAAAEATGWFAAHELRTPLQGIQGGVALLLEERGAGLSSLQLEALGLIATAAADLERCIAHLAELAALDTAPAAPPERLALGVLLAALGQPRETCGPELAAATALDVLIAPAPAGRALRHLAALAPSGDRAAGLDCSLETLADERVILRLPLGPRASGDGAVLWHVAATLMQRAGGRLQLAVDGTTRLILRRAPCHPI
jgi:hypothetical protein